MSVRCRVEGLPTLALDQGAALLSVLIVTGLVTAVGLGLLQLSLTERQIAANDHTGLEALNAAEAILERGLLDLQGLVAWDGVLSGAVQSSFSGATLSPVLPSGGVLDLGAETAALQSLSDSTSSQGSNNPVWRLFAHGSLGDLIGSTTTRPWPYVVLWVGDDLAGADDDPERDANETVTLRAHAYGLRAARRRVEATVTRADPTNAFPGRFRVLVWREIR